MSMGLGMVTMFVPVSSGARAADRAAMAELTAIERHPRGPALGASARGSRACRESSGSASGHAAPACGLTHGVIMPGEQRRAERVRQGS